MVAAPGELSGLLAVLLDAEVEFILVGGGAAVLHGAPITTQDVDIVHNRAPENVARLLGALAAMDAQLHDLAGRSLLPTRGALLGPGQSQFRSSFGRLDILGTLHDGRGWAELLPTADTVDFDRRKLRIVDLPTLIEIKSTTGRAKDRLVVPILIELARRRDAPGRE